MPHLVFLLCLRCMRPSRCWVHVSTHIPEYRFAQRHIPPSGAMMVLPSWVKEYSTAMAFDVVTRLAINPVDSSLRRVLVSIRWETLPRCRPNSPCRRDFSLSENKILDVHLPIKIGAGVFDPCIVFIASCFMQKFLSENNFSNLPLTLFFCRPSPFQLASSCGLSAIRNICVPRRQGSLRYWARKRRTDARAP